MQLQTTRVRRLQFAAQAAEPHLVLQHESERNNTPQRKRESPQKRNPQIGVGGAQPFPKSPKKDRRQYIDRNGGERRRAFRLRRGNLAGDEEHDPTEQDGGTDEEDEAVGAVTNHGARSVAHGDSEYCRGEEREEHDCEKMRRVEH